MLLYARTIPSRHVLFERGMKCAREDKSPFIASTVVGNRGVALILPIRLIFFILLASPSELNTVDRTFYLELVKIVLKQYDPTKAG